MAGGNMAGRGGALSFGNTSILTNCMFTGNTSGAFGGAANFSNSATLTDCVFTGNTAGTSGGAASFSNSATLTNCVVADNRANTNGGGVWFGRGATVINSTFYNNTAGAQNENGGGIYIANHADPVTLQNNLLIGNSAVEGDQVYVVNTDAARVITLQHNLIAGGDTGIVYTNSGASGIMETNTVTEADSSVVFASTTADEDNYLHLKEGSPAVNVGNNDYVNNASPAITTDLAGVARIRRGRVDLGAYESDYKGTQTIDFTLDSTGVVGMEDIVLVAMASSGLPVSYVSSNPAAAVVDTMEGSATLRLIAEGTAIITASQSGDDTYAAATDVTQTIVVTGPRNPTGNHGWRFDSRRQHMGKSHDLAVRPG